MRAATRECFGAGASGEELGVLKMKVTSKGEGKSS